MWEERKSQVKYDSQTLYLNLWKNGVPFMEMIRTQEVQWAGAYQQVHFGYITFELSIDIQVDIIT